MDLVRGHFTSDPVVDTVDDHALVTGHSVHVIVDPDTGKSMTIPPDMREKLSQLNVNFTWEKKNTTVFFFPIFWKKKYRCFQI